jgi:ABC-2 type transport system permease protein
MGPLPAMIVREAKIRSTNFTFLFFDLFYPLLYLLIFGVGINAALTPARSGDAGYSAFFLAGVLALANFGIASSSSWSFFLDRDNGIFLEMLTYPMRRSEYLLGKLLFNVALAFVQAALTLGIGAGLLGLRLDAARLPLLAALVAIGVTGWFFVYSSIALRIRRNDVFNSVTNISYFVLMFASSVFYPLAPLPAWFRAAALANPLTWEADWLRYATLGTGAPQRLAWEAAAFAVFTAASFLFAVRSLREQG